jgi:hypothetical protein
VHALRILNNRYEYGTAEKTLELLKPCNEGIKMNCWEALYMQKVNDIIPLYELAQHIN